MLWLTLIIMMLMKILSWVPTLEMKSELMLLQKVLV